MLEKVDFLKKNNTNLKPENVKTEKEFFEIQVLRDFKDIGFFLLKKKN